MRKGLKMICDGRQIYPQLQGNERISMLLVGESRMGKTYFASCLGAELIRQKGVIHLIDLGDKWSTQDKERLLRAGAAKRQVERDGIVLVFNTVKEVCGCGRIITNALGFRSARAVMVIRKAIKWLLSMRGQQFVFSDLVEYLETVDEDLEEDQEWQLKIWERLDSCGEVPHIVFRLDKKSDFSTDSLIWDLSGLEDTYVQIAAYLIAFCLLCQEKRRFRNGDAAKKVFVIIDEFQVLECDKKSIIGTCLTEGQKYGLALILITQFLKGNFSEAVVQQFKQGGFQFYFRLTEEDAASVSKAIAGSGRERSHLCKKLITLSRGHCLMKGPNFIEGSDEITEACRFVEIRDEQDA